MWMNWLKICMTAVFRLTTINPLETEGFGRILHTFATSMGMLQTLPLILEN